VGWADAGWPMEASWADVEAEAADAGRPMEVSWADVEAEAADVGWLLFSFSIPFSISFSN
jgi:hypothetical protein